MAGFPIRDQNVAAIAAMATFSISISPALKGMSVKSSLSFHQLTFFFILFDTVEIGCRNSCKESVCETVVRFWGDFT
jgi:hypothetical protein